jgi:hypothetical protein
MEPVAPDTTSTPIPNPFDLPGMALSQDYLKAGSVRKLPPPISIGKPRDTYFRIHPEFRQTYGVIEVKAVGKVGTESYVVMPQMQASLEGEFKHKVLLVGMTRQGGLFVWPLSPQQEGERNNDWVRTAWEGVEQAVGEWVRLKSNMDLLFYEVSVAEADFGEPNWPDQTYSQILQRAFKTEGLIGSPDHPVAMRLRGAV